MKIEKTRTPVCEQYCGVRTCMRRCGVYVILKQRDVYAERILVTSNLRPFGNKLTATL